MSPDSGFARVFLVVCACLGVLVAVPCCGEAEVQAGTGVPAAQQPTRERLLLRVRQRLEAVEGRDLVAAHSYCVPAVRREQPLGQYLQRMEMHRYEGCALVEVVAVEDGQAYVRTTALWTPTHPKVREVKLEPGQTLSQRIEILETWRFEEGDWGFVKQERVDEFFAARPDLLKKP